MLDVLLMSARIGYFDKNILKASLPKMKKPTEYEPLRILYFEALNRKIKIISVPKEMELPGYPLHSPFSFYTGNKSFLFIAGNIRRQ